MSRILIIEDNRNLSMGLKNNLECEGHETDLAGDGSIGLARVRTGLYDLVILDLMLPGIDGYRVLEGIREVDGSTPVIVLTARADEADKVKGLGLGADDYVTKPFALAELLARIDAVLRRSQPVTPSEPAPEPAESGDVARFADVVVDNGQRTVTRGGEPVKLTHLEFELLLFFARHPYHVFNRNRLLGLVWGQTAGSPRTVDNFVGQLRKRFEVDPERPRHFITVRGSGYRFDP